MKEGTPCSPFRRKEFQFFAEAPSENNNARPFTASRACVATSWALPAMWTRTTLAACLCLVAAATATTPPQVSRAVADEAPLAGATTVSDDAPDVEGRLRSLMDRLIHESLPRMTALGSGSNVTGDCSAALFRLLLGMRKFEPWALRLLDANSRPPGGLISGTFNDLGTYDQCLSTAARDADGGVHFSGQYCTLYLQPRRLPFFEKIVRRLHDEVYDGVSVPLLALQSVTALKP
ncbi:hypothetical protein V5799_013340 [Amblyomma americanum]|uniref:Nose resistant-to-fluoxetine protein N-terminal domain-containing protein n=1 Tax=Amblyomma americanum TaxID=6943 RepID=A0AAQ4E666_AMBAM